MSTAGYQLLPVELHGEIIKHAVENCKCAADFVKYLLVSHFFYTHFYPKLMEAITLNRPSQLPKLYFTLESTANQDGLSMEFLTKTLSITCEVNRKTHRRACEKILHRIRVQKLRLLFKPWQALLDQFHTVFSPTLEELHIHAEYLPENLYDVEEDNSDDMTVGNNFPSSVQRLHVIFELTEGPSRIAGRIDFAHLQSLTHIWLTFDDSDAQSPGDEFRVTEVLPLPDIGDWINDYCPDELQVLILEKDGGAESPLEDEEYRKYVDLPLVCLVNEGSIDLKYLAVEEKPYAEQLTFDAQGFTTEQIWEHSLAVVAQKNSK
ncbi:hypothetical protein F5879DRAFT_991228 [Lentinula edodes]|nr:hypothetical protein F5879DRAFT_991228 [Lentinula edodes]